MPAQDRKENSCFVIAPIGASGSPERRRSDQVFTHIIEPVARNQGFTPVRADHLGKPGLITSQVIEHLLDDPLVIADLTGANPNVYYELAIRHATRKPAVLLVSLGERLPFDVAPARTIQFDYQDLDSVATAKSELTRQIENAKSNPDDVDSPVSVAVDVKSLRASGGLTEKSLAQILSRLQDVEAQVVNVGQVVTQRLERKNPFIDSPDEPRTWSTQYLREFIRARNEVAHQELSNLEANAQKQEELLRSAHEVERRRKRLHGGGSGSAEDRPPPD